MVDFNLRLGKSKDAETLNLNDMKSGLSQKDITNTRSGCIFNENDMPNSQLENDYNNIFNALDNGGKTKGVLEDREIQFLKNKVKEFSKNETFSKREAGNLLKSLGLKDVKAETFFGFLKDVVGLSANIDSAETDDQGNTTVKYVAKEGSQQTVTKNSAGDVTQTRIDNLEDETFVIKDSSGKIVKGKDAKGEYTRTELVNNLYRINRGEEYADYTNIDGQQVEIGGKDKNGEYTRTQLENGGFRIQRGDNYKDFSVVDGKQVEIRGKDKDGEYTRTQLENGGFRINRGDNYKDFSVVDGKQVEVGGKDKDGKYTRTELDNGYMLARKNPDNLRYATTESIYDENGHELNRIYKDAKDNVAGSREFSYDDKGNSIKTVIRDAKGNVTSSHNSTYDENGNMLQRIYKDDKRNIKSIYKCFYDDKGNRIKTIARDAKGNVMGSYKSTYDGNGNLLSNTYIGSKGDVLSREEYLNENKLNCIQKDAKGDLKYAFHEHEDFSDMHPTVKYLVVEKAGGNVSTGAKNGETFDATMERLGIKAEDQEVFRKANKKAEARGWFMVGELDVTIPKELAEKLDLFNHPEKIAFDVAQEEDNYKWQQEQKAKQ